MYELATACLGRYLNTGHIFPKGYEFILMKDYESILWMVQVLLCRQL